jgi:hypothetical protein
MGTGKGEGYYGFPAKAGNDNAKTDCFAFRFGGTARNYTEWEAKARNSYRVKLSNWLKVLDNLSR